MTVRDTLLALLVVAIWGVNFVLIKIGLAGVPPLLLCALRFFLAAVPAVFFLPRPSVPWNVLWGYGLFYFAFQFGFLFTAMHTGVSAGLASLLLQLQVFFTMGLSYFFYKDRPGAYKIGGALIAFGGMAIVASHAGTEMNPLGLMLILVAAFCFAMGNIVSKRLAGANPLALVVWGSLLACPLLAGMSFVIEGPKAIHTALIGISWKSLGALAYIVYLSTHLGFSLWSSLLRRHPASSVAPFTLLVPVFGFFTSALFLGEELPMWKLQAALLVILGLCLAVLGSRLKLRRIRS